MKNIQSNLSKLLTISFVVITAIITPRLAFAQITGPTTVCPDVYYTYSIPSVAGYDRVTWSATNGTVGLNLNSPTASAKFTANGTITINYWEQNEPGLSPPYIKVSGETLNVTIYKIGTLSVPSGNTCAPQLTRTGGTLPAYSWEQSPAGANSWTQVSTSTATWIVTPITQNSDFRVTSGSTCSTPLVSNVVTATVLPPPTSAGSISAAATEICYGGSLSITNAASPAPSALIRWQYSENGGTTWTDVPAPDGAGLGLSLNNVTTSRQYRRRAEYQCNSSVGLYSNVISTTVTPYATVGTFSASTYAVCGTGDVTLSISSVNATNRYWQYRYSDNGGTSYATAWIDYSTSTALSTTFTVAPTATGNRRFQFRLHAENGVCGINGSKTTPEVTVDAITTNLGSSGPALVESFGAVAGTLSITGTPTGPYFQQWEQSTDGGTTWVPAAGTNNSMTYNYNVSSTTLFRGRGINTGCPSYLYTNNSQVLIAPTPVILVQGNASAELAIGSSLTLQSNNPYYSYQWVTESGVDIPSATSSTYTITQPGVYKLRVKSSASSPSITVSKTIYAIGHEASNLNMSITTVIKKSGVTPSTDLYQLNPNEYAQSISYTDGLSRPVQNIAVGQSPQKHDIIIPYSYDPSASINYLPYVPADKTGKYRSSAIMNGTYAGSDQYAFYQSAAKVETSTAPYSKSIIENSPLRTVIEEGAPGSDWQPGGGHSIRSEFQTNAANDVRYFVTAGFAGYYAANTLAVTKILDENGNAIYTYTDKAGHEILKRVQVDATTYLETYSVFDTRGNLITQIPPKASDLLNTGTTYNVYFRDQYCFVYNYDTRGRLIEIKVPDADWVYNVYDPLDRLVLTQDANLRSQNKWAFTKYDFKGRSVMVGLYTNTTKTTRAALQSDVDVIYSSSSSSYPTNSYYETHDKIAGTHFHGYNNVSFPNANVGTANPLEVLAVNYYDDYDFDLDGNADFSYTSQSISGEGTQASAFDLPTGSKRVIMGTSDWLYTYMFYDKFGRVIQTRTNNHLSLTVDNLATNIYDFEGKLLQTKTYHNAGGSNQTTIVNKTEYDHAGRPVNIYENINNQSTDQLLSKYNYNEIGQLIERDLHSTGAAFLQTVDYRYNIRGWLKSINDAQLTDPTDFFGMNLLYNESDGGLNNAASFNGNVSAVKWKGSGSASGATDQRSYNFIYDKSDRLVGSAYKKYGTTAWNQEKGMLDEWVKYDKGGNILLMGRHRIKRDITTNFTVSATKELLDSLTYYYSGSKSGRMERVEDSGIATEGFKNGSAQAYEYGYSSDGNVISDLNKGISAIAYNSLNKVSSITFSGSPAKTVTYTYDGAGTKLKVVTYDGTTTTTTDYIGGFLYQNSVLSFVSTPEGRAVKSGSNFEYQYNITDHQGNTRVVFSAAAPTPDTYTATFEDNTITSETSTFTNYPSGGNRSSLELFDHTDFSGTTYSHSQLLNGGNGSQVGLAKTLKVYPGDKIHAEVYAKYWNETSTTSNITGFGAALTSAFGLTSGMTGEALKAFGALNNYGGIVATAGGTGDEEDAPKAYLTVLMYDQNFRFVDASYIRITTNAEQDANPSNKTAFELMSRDVTITEPGYAYIYVSNENPTKVDVYFDDMSITHTKSNVIQYNEYYPFGLRTQNSWTRETAVDNSSLYNRGSELNGLTDLYDTFFRQYDPTLGRFIQVDPLAPATVNYSVYHYSSNNPVTHNDPTGAVEGILGYRGISTLGYAMEPTTWTMEDGSGSFSGGYNYGHEFGTVVDLISKLLLSPFGGTWTQESGLNYFHSEVEVGTNKNGDQGYWQDYGLKNEAGIGTHFTAFGSKATNTNNADKDSKGDSKESNFPYNGVGLALNIIGGGLTPLKSEYRSLLSSATKSSIKGVAIGGKLLGAVGFALSSYQFIDKVLDPTKTVTGNDIMDISVGAGTFVAGLMIANPVGVAVLIGVGVGYGLYTIWRDDGN